MSNHSSKYRFLGSHLDKESKHVRNLLPARHSQTRSRVSRILSILAYLLNLFLKVSNSTFSAVRFDEHVQSLWRQLHLLRFYSAILLCLWNEIALSTDKKNITRSLKNMEKQMTKKLMQIKTENSKF